MICGFCHCECTMEVEDNSFDHAFGTETILTPVSDCCEADLFVTDFPGIAAKKYDMSDFPGDPERDDYDEPDMGFD